MRFPVKATSKMAVKPAPKIPPRVRTDAFVLKLGCLSVKDEAVYRCGKMRHKRFYHLSPLVIERPDRGITEEKINCQTCGRHLYVTVYSRIAGRLKRLSALGFSLLPVTVAVAASLLLNYIKHSYPAGSRTAADLLDNIKGFAIVIFLALVWMIPVFLPVVFRKEYKLALRLQTEKDDRTHRLYEANMESVTQETYYK